MSEIRVNKKVKIIARMCHEANRVMQLTLREPVNPPWDELSDDLKNSTYVGVMHALGGVSSRELHESWMEERYAQGWKFGPVLDRANKLHPNLVPYDHLPLEQQNKDKLFRVIVQNYAR